jgi:predicted RNase H-like nuclease (RuvC/YqgF family)
MVENLMTDYGDKNEPDEELEKTRETIKELEKLNSELKAEVEALKTKIEAARPRFLNE